MKFAAPLALFALASSAHALTNSIIASRQAHIRRDLIDVCAGLDVDLKLLEVLRNNQPVVTGHLDVCLCVSAIPDFIQVNAAAKAAVTLLDTVKVSAVLEALIRAAPGHETCHYPTHASPICDAANPCNFDCTDGYQAFPADHPTSCVCPAPSTECNGKCGYFPNGCGSAVPARRRSVPTCAKGRELCGVPGGSKGKGWECVDTKTDLESCGGCTAQSPFGTSRLNGLDCSAILHVADVLCLNAKCLVKACRDGFIPSSTADSCVPVHINRGVVAGTIEDTKAQIGRIADIKEVGIAGVAVARRDLVAGVVEAVKGKIGNLADANEIGAAGIHVARYDNDIVAGAVEDATGTVGHVIDVKEVGIAGLQVARGFPIADTVEVIHAKVDGLANANEAGIAGARVTRNLVAGAVEKADATVGRLADVKEAGIASAIVARYGDGLVAGVVEVAEANAGHLADAKEVGVAGIQVARSLAAGVEGAKATVNHVVNTQEVGVSVAGVRLSRRFRRHL